MKKPEYIPAVGLNGVVRQAPFNAHVAYELICKKILLAGVFVLLVGVLVLLGTLGVWTLLTFVALPRMWEVIKVYNEPPPAEAPPGYPIWPLWYVAWAFTLTRRAGAFFVLGLLANAVYPIHL